MPLLWGFTFEISRPKDKVQRMSELHLCTTRPSDGQRILVTENEIVRVEELWAIKNGTHEDFLNKRKNYNNEIEFLRVKYNRQPTDSEIQISILQKELPAHAENGDWGLYRNSKASIAKLFFKAKNYKAALKEYLEVQFLDLNGPNHAYPINAGCRLCSGI